MIWSVVFEGQPTEILMLILARSGCMYGMITNNEEVPKVVGLNIKTKTEKLELKLGDTLTWDSVTGKMEVIKG